MRLTIKYIVATTAAILALCLIACNENKPDTTGLAAIIGDKTLTLEEVSRNVPPSLSGTDSLRFANHFINQWVEEQAITVMAEKSIPDTREIDRMVDDYRRQLLMWEYMRAMTQQNATTDPTDKEIASYYEKNKQKLILTRPAVKGLYIKLPADAPETGDIRKLYRSEKFSDIDKLEKLLTHAVNYEYFRDVWTDWGELESRIPSKEIDDAPDNFPINNDHLEVKADGYIYFLNITESMPAGGTMPLEIARTHIVESLKREAALSYTRQLRKQLFDKALDEGVAKIFVDTTY